MPGPEYETLLRRRRIWGVPPGAVARMAAECGRAQAELRERTRELELRLAQITAERDEASRSVAALQEEVGRLERENAAIALRPEAMREEAVRFVVDAWAEARAIRAQTRREIAEAEEAARARATAIREALAAERERHAAEIAALRARRREAIAALESLAESLLRHAGRSIDPRVPGPAAAADPAASPLARSSEPVEAAPRPIAGDPPHHDGGGAEDQLLARALDDLETILGASRKPHGPA